MKFLNNPFVYEENMDDDFFKMSSKSIITKLAREVLMRLFKKNRIEEMDENVDIVDTSDNIDENAHDTVDDNVLRKRLQNTVNQVLSSKSESGNDDYRCLLREINLSEATGKLTKNLECLFSALKTIRPTSTQNERNFSISNNFCTKIRSRLLDEHLNQLCFLKNIFVQEKQKRDH